jgi:Pyruvate/2-oxoacid:ferredoxin oxidoreductase delta subunit/flavodoxin
MGARIFCFSGTGNSLYVARRIAGGLDDCEVESIAALSGPGSGSRAIQARARTIGFVFPVYSQNIPEMVDAFVRRLEFEGKPYIFSIATNNGSVGRANHRVAKLLGKKGQRLSLGMSILMPGNSVIIRDYTNDEAERAVRLRRAEGLIDQCAEKIKRMDRGTAEADMGLRTYMKGIVTTIARKAYGLPRRFSVNDKCSGCRGCVRICPENNVRDDGGIAWGGACSNCLACYHWCPQGAVELGSGGSRKPRYHHPAIRMSDLYLR